MGFATRDFILPWQQCLLLPVSFTAGVGCNLFLFRTPNIIAAAIIERKKVPIPKPE